MKIQTIVYVTDMPRSVAFYEALGLTPKTADRSGMWFEFALGGAVLALHKTPALPPAGHTHVELSFVATAPLEALVSDLHARGLTTHPIVDEAFGRSFRVTDPDGLSIQINEHDESLYT